MRAAPPAPRPSPVPPRRGFTLVELLIVIIIIGLLTGLLVTAIGRAMISSRDARIIAEIEQLDQALKQYRDKYGSFPPSYLKASGTGNNDAAVKRHLRKAFPRMSPTSISYTDLNPAEAFVFFLGGVPATSGGTKITGFNMNPTSPMTAGGQRTTPMFQFDQTRLLDKLDSNGNPGTNGFWEYYPPGCEVPYIYIDAGHYAGFPGIGNTTAGYAYPYKDAAVTTNTAANDASGGYMNANSFQIISSGQDNNYGKQDSNKIFPTGANYDPAGTDLDNLTNFTTKRLEESM